MASTKRPVKFNGPGDEREQDVMPHWWASSTEEIFNTEIGEADEVTEEMVQTAAYEIGLDPGESVWIGRSEPVDLTSLFSLGWHVRDAMEEALFEQVGEAAGGWMIGEKDWVALEDAINSAIGAWFAANPGAKPNCFRILDTKQFTVPAAVST